jgi:hypothetical protein
VTIKEKETSIGGKLFARPFKPFGNDTTFYVEHGFHGIVFLVRKNKKNS